MNSLTSALMARKLVTPARALSLDHISHNGLHSSTEYPFALLRGFAQRLSLTLGPRAIA